jgi:hypothetical protein
MKKPSIEELLDQLRLADRELMRLRDGPQNERKHWEKQYREILGQLGQMRGQKKEVSYGARIGKAIPVSVDPKLALSSSRHSMKLKRQLLNTGRRTRAKTRGGRRSES